MVMRQATAAFPLTASVFKDLAQQPRAVLQAAAVLVGPIVIAPRQEVVEPAEAVARVNVNDVELCRQGPANRLEMPMAQLGDVGLGHRTGLNRIVIP